MLSVSGPIRKAGGGAVGFWPDTKSGGGGGAVGFWPDTKSGGYDRVSGTRDIVQ